MSQEIFEGRTDVYKAMKLLIGKYHPHLADVKDQIFVYFKEKASTPGGVTVAGKSRKAPPLLSAGLVTENNRRIIFVIELGYDYWKALSDKQKTALLDHHLCAMVVEESQQGGITYGIKPPDFVGYREEVERWGLWRPAQNPKAKTFVEQMFGAEEEEEEEETEEEAEEGED